MIVKIHWVISLASRKGKKEWILDKVQEKITTPVEVEEAWTCNMFPELIILPYGRENDWAATGNGENSEKYSVACGSTQRYMISMTNCNGYDTSKWFILSNWFQLLDCIRVDINY